MEFSSTLPTNLQFYSGLQSETNGFINVRQGRIQERRVHQVTSKTVGLT